MRRHLVIDVVLIVAAIALSAIRLPQAFIENAYANGLFAHLNATVVPIANAVPFALGDLLVAIVVVALVTWWAGTIRRARGGRWRAIAMLAVHTAGFVALTFIAFELLWALNYRRAPLVARVAFDPARVDERSVHALTARIVDTLNAEVGPAHARMAIESSDAMRSQLARDFAPLARRIGDRWDVALTVPKRTIADHVYAMAGVGGQYDPYAFETLVNGEFLPFEIPRALAHEWAHVAGFGDEGDANLIGTLTCLRSPDPLIRYSGAFWTYGDLPESERAKLTLAPAVIADFAASRERFLRSYQPRLFAISWGVYDHYLRANGVRAGVVSYSAFVQILAGTPLDADGLPMRR